ncbi:YDL183C [Zygosaccharomyces parabailii]|nr:YDL183C [Zygosaccharomyces parabailii]CDH13467.1 uncharacterized protein ZBAI_05253 [Zygosaccharomyces bailii ISA1307]
MLRIPVKQFLLEPVKLVVIPVTTQRVYLYHKHSDEMLSKSSTPIRAESWLSRKSANMWNKIEQSPRPINKKLVGWIKELLNKTPWMEDSLRSIPGENHILKRVATRSPNGGEKVEKLTVKQFNRTNLEAEPLPTFYPSSVFSPDQLSSIFKKFYTEGLRYHKKQTLLCLLGLPLTIPVVLIPIIPNVPGFYLCYRAYCNYKAYTGARHLQALCKDHKLDLKDVEGYSELFDGKRAVPGKEILLLNMESMHRILDHLQIHEIESHLRKVIQQEKKRLEIS